MNYPENYRYTKEHEWVCVEGDVGTVGITFHAQSELGDIVYVDMPVPGTAVKAGETLGSVESVKAVSDIYSPVTGQVVEALRSVFSGKDQVRHAGIMRKMPGARQQAFGKPFRWPGVNLDFGLKIPAKSVATMITHERGFCAAATCCGGSNSGPSTIGQALAPRIVRCGQRFRWMRSM